MNIAKIIGRSRVGFVRDNWTTPSCRKLVKRVTRRAVRHYLKRLDLRDRDE